MADAVTPRWNGDKYQARVFWHNALHMLATDSVVVEVTFEADAPKAFDDVVVKYDPPIAGSGPVRVPATYHQVKWHVELGGRFGYKDFIEPDFIGATSVSLLQRLREAKKIAPAGAQFDFVTTYRIHDDDPLSPLLSGTDRSILIDRLFDGTTDRSKTGKIRKLWREHLGLASDDALKAVVSGLRIFDGQLSLDELRSQVNLRAEVVGALTCRTNSDFRYDGLAQALKSRRLNSFTRETLRAILAEEGLLVEVAPLVDAPLPVAIRSFHGLAADLSIASPENTLVLTEAFNQRYLRADRSWQDDIGPRVSTFLAEAVRRSGKLRLSLDAHASIAFLAGSVLDVKSGVDTTLVQKGRVGSREWRADDGTETDAARLVVTSAALGKGRDIAVALGVSRDAEKETRAYIAKSLKGVGKLLTFAMPSGPGQQVVAGGGHAAALAEQVANQIRDAREEPDAVVHIFAACPNSVMFFLGQEHRGVAPCVVYEFDFDRRGHKSYQPSFVIE